MLAIVFAAAPAIYAWYATSVGHAIAVAIISYGAFVAFASVQSRKVEPIWAVLSP